MRVIVFSLVITLKMIEKYIFNKEREKMVFLREFLRNRKQIGSVIPSSNRLTKAMVNQIDYKKAKVIVELGAGLGTFTDLLVEKIGNETVLIVVEINDNFFEILKKRFENRSNIIIVKDSAENLDKILDKLNYEKADFVISGLPFLNFSKELREKIFKVVSNSINCNFILFQYTRILESELLQYYNLVEREKIYFNIPPANVYVLEKLLS